MSSIVRVSVSAFTKSVSARVSLGCVRISVLRTGTATARADGGDGDRGLGEEGRLNLCQRSSHLPGIAEVSLNISISSVTCGLRSERLLQRFEPARSIIPLVVWSCMQKEEKQGRRRK